VLIREVKLTPVTVPFTQPEIWSGGSRSGITSIIVEVVTDEGIVGVGEAVPAPSPEVTQAALLDMRKLIIGEDPARIEHLINKLYSVGGFYPLRFRHRSGQSSSRSHRPGAQAAGRRQRGLVARHCCAHPA